MKFINPMLVTLFLSFGFSGYAAAQETTNLNIAYQDAGFPALIKKSGVLNNASFKINWVILTGPAANLSALYGGAIDVGHMGDTSLTIEQANARTPWTVKDAPLKIVAGWRSDYSRTNPPLVTAIRTAANINTPSELAGHTWAYNYGGYNHAQYLISLVKANLSEKDIKPTRFNDGSSAAAAFNSGQTDVYSGSLGPILQSVNNGSAKILWTDRDTGIPGLGVWTARAAVLNDPAKDAALKEFFGDLSHYWAWHQSHKKEVIETLISTLKLTPERAAYEYEVRGGAFRPFDADLFKAEQNVADVLYQGGAIKRKVDVRIGFDDRYSQVQKTTPVKVNEAGGE